MMDGVAPLSLIHALDLYARYRADRPVLTDARGSWTYAELWRRVDRIGSKLARAGVGPGTTVAIAAPATSRSIAAMLAVWRVGGGVAPLNVRCTSAELVDYLNAIAARFVLGTPGMVDALGHSPSKRVPFSAESGLVLDRIDAHAPVEGGAIVLPTGGTTGAPKAARFTTAALSAWLSSCAAHGRVVENDSELFVAPTYHGTLVTGLLTTLAAGGHAILQDRFDAELAARAMASGSVTRMLGAATVIERIADAFAGEPPAKSRMRFLHTGMSSSRRTLMQELQMLFPCATLSTGYGATEFGPVARTCSEGFVNGQPVGVGRPVPHADIRVLVDGKPSTDFEVEGELVVRTPWQMRGYAGGAAPDSMIHGFIRSGDIGRFDAEGRLFLRGRLKEIIRTGAETVFPAEVENVLQSHPLVRQCAVFGVADPRWGERVEASVVAIEPDVDAAALIRHLRTRLAGYKVPKVINLVDHLPLTSNNKIDKRALAAAAQRAGR
jgi:fatty-acyl-CoA synthase